jgi:hypothetical protein
MNAPVARRIVVPVLMLAALALLAPAAPAAKRARCAVKGSHTVAKSRLVRAYVKRDREGNRRLYGCVRKTGRKLLVAAEYDDQYVTSGVYRDVRLEGRFVAVVFEATDVSCKAACPPGYETTQTSVVVRDIRARKSRIARSLASHGTLQLSDRGFAAWLAPVDDGAELRVIDGAGLGRVVDTGAIDPASVALPGRELEWVKDGTPAVLALTPF